MTVSTEIQPLDSAGTPDLDEQTMREMYRYMLLARALDERMWLLNRAGQAPFAVSCQGHEGAGAGTRYIDRGVGEGMRKQPLDERRTADVAGAEH